MTCSKILGKRKHQSNDPSRSKEKAKKHRKELNADELPWKEVTRPKEAGLDEFEGMLMLEEVEDVEIVYEDTGSGKVAKFNVKERDEDEAVEEVDLEEDWHGIPDVDTGAKEEQTESSIPPIPIPEDAGVSQANEEWGTFALDPWLIQGLAAQKFTTPTPIQTKAIPRALQGRDVIGIAQTGSGKTLAYGLPILQHLIASKSSSTSTERVLQALILAPTRELALQVSTHLNACLTPLVKSERSDSGAPPRVSVAAIVGGMSPQKQRRILDRGVDVLVATPGRLWDILGQDDKLAIQIRQARFLVLDEADRMIEQGHFQELDNILRLTLRVPKFEQGDLPEGVQQPPTDEETTAREDMQTFIFSATLSKNLQKNLKRKGRRKDNNASSTLDDLLLRLDFRDAEPEVIDISPEGGVVSTLKESRIECLTTDKDVYLYYFLLRYPGRSLVFVSSVDGIRRLTPLLDLLKLKGYPLHSQLEQRQRLKNLDQFKTSDNGVLIATDIAARGLDIPAVDHVIHFQVPRTADAYVHRNGRTARAGSEGFAVLMCAPDERKGMRGLFSSLGRQESDISELNVDHDILNKLKHRVELAREIDKAQHRLTKRKHEENWMQETAKALDVILDSDAEEETVKHEKRKEHDHKVASLKAELNHLLSKPVIARGVSSRYITSGSKSIADDILSGNVHASMLGIQKSKAEVDVSSAKPSNHKKRRKVSSKQTL